MGRGGGGDKVGERNDRVLTGSAGDDEGANGVAEDKDLCVCVCRSGGAISQCPPTTHPPAHPSHETPCTPRANKALFLHTNPPTHPPTPFLTYPLQEQARRNELLMVQVP